MEMVVISYLKHLGIPISKQYVSRLILSHPDYPSLVSISDVLQRLGIPHQAIKVSGSKAGNLATPFMLKADSGNGELQFIKTEKELSKLDKLYEEESVIVLQAEPVAEVTDPKNTKAIREEKNLKYSAVILAITIVCIIALFSAPLWTEWLYAGLLITSIFVVIPAKLTPHSGVK